MPLGGRAAICLLGFCIIGVAVGAQQQENDGCRFRHARTVRAAEMDLTRTDRAAANPAGVVFYKVWNGR